MRFLVGLVLVLIGIIFVQSAPVVRQATDSLVDFEGLDSEFDEFLAEMADILTPDQYQAFQQELFELIMSEASGDLDPVAIQLKFQILLEKYLGLYSESRSDLSQHYFAQKFVEVVIASVPYVVANVQNAVGKRQATDDLVSVNQLSTTNLEALLAAAPQLSALINPIHEALAQLATIISPAQLQLLQEQALQLVLNVGTGNIDVNQFKEQLQALFEQYSNSNGKNQVDIDQLIEQVIVTDTAGLPDIIVNVLGKRDVNELSNLVHKNN